MEQKFQYRIEGYRSMLGSFRVFRGFPGQEKAEIQLCATEHRRLGMCYLSNGFCAAVAFAEHLIQEHESKREPEGGQT